MYYSLVSGFPDLGLDLTENKKFSLKEIKESVLMELVLEDVPMLEALFLPYDNNNLLDILYKKDDNLFIDKGKFSALEINDTVSASGGTLLPYMEEFIDYFKSLKPTRIVAEKHLEEFFLGYISSLGNSFLVDWYKFEQKRKNIISVLIKKRFAQEFTVDIVGDMDNVDAFIDNIIKNRSKDNKNLVGSIKTILAVENLIEREKKIDLLRLEFNSSQVSESGEFDLNSVLALVNRAIVIDRWASLSIEKGIEVFNEALSRLEYNSKKENTEKTA